MLRRIQGRIWDYTSANDYVATRLAHRGPFGLKFLSACDYLKLSPITEREKSLKGVA